MTKIPFFNIKLDKYTFCILNGGMEELMIVLIDNERNATLMQVESKESTIRYTYECMLSLKENRQYRDMKTYIDKQLKHAEESKTQRCKDKIYNQIEHYKQRTKDVFGFDYDMHVDKIVETENTLKTLEDELKILKDKSVELQKQFEMEFKNSKSCSESYLSHMDTNIPLYDKVWNRRSNR